jgi:hypothetical protein
MDLIELHNIKFGKNPPVGAQLFHAVLQTDRRLDVHDKVTVPIAIYARIHLNTMHVTK